YEGYGPGGAAILVESMTDNRNRTVAEVRNAFTRGGGNLGESGCVGWLFDSRGVISIEANGSDGEEVALMAIDAGADDVRVEGSTIEVYTAIVEPSTRTSSAPASIAMSATSSPSLPLASIEITPRESNSQPTQPDSPRLPPPRVKALRTSATVRLRLSVIDSTRIAAPPGP